MAHFKKSGGFKKPFQKRSFGDRPSFGGGKSFGGGGKDGQKEMHAATCSTCGTACEVPFRPAGDRPIYCRNCFGGKSEAPRGDFNRRDDKRSFEPRRQAPSFNAHNSQVPRPQGDVRIDELKRQIDAVHNKLDVVVKMIEKLSVPAAVTVEEAAPEAPVKKAVKAKKAKK